jgi:hypothetical protein
MHPHDGQLLPTPTDLAFPAAIAYDPQPSRCINSRRYLSRRAFLDLYEVQYPIANAGSPFGH